MKKHDQISCTRFLWKYGVLSLYGIDVESIYNLDEKYINFVKKYGYDLIGNLDNPDETSSDHEYFFIRDDLFEFSLENEQNSDIVLKVINKYV